MAKRFWLLHPLIASAAVLASCQGKGASDQDSGRPPGPSPGSVVTADPEPRGSGFKTLDDSCTQPVVRVAEQPLSVASTFDPMAKAFVQEHREFSPPAVQFAEAELGGRRLLLARCRDSTTANRLAARMRDRIRHSRAVPVCGFAASGWTASRRRVHVE
ncbi:MAG: hypothetical protein MUF54_20740 [Polyangiaceae bacterium]|nr:hypothetical protein [Polyangiaceae bacterium]